MSKQQQPGILCVANWKSDVGYAWWLMESYWVKISEMFSDSHITFLAYPEINAIPQHIEESEIRYFQHTFRPETFSDIRHNIAIIKKYNIRVLYLSDYGVSSLAYAMYRAAGVDKIIVHDHTPGLRTKASGLKKHLKTVKANFPLLRADAAFGATSFVTRRLTETACFSEKRCFTVQNGILPFDCAPATDGRLNRLFSGNTNKIIVTAARANKYKGIDFALEVIAKLVHEHQFSDIGYLLCGDGPDLDSFRQLARELDITQYCYFPGRVDKASEILCHCYLGFQPAKGEVGYSLSILEYMYAGLPVIVPDNPSVCEATDDGKTGAIYSQDNVESAAQAIADYLSKPDRQEQHGKAAREQIQQHYTLAATHDALRKAMEQVVR
ncbi:glycosyltransferase family 4 protein [Salinimonas sp. HHU 13199]|uniref:Glycosyltransferase family 4 protein n=1 Tax=Salinimonas profundi TaxID=2729140 RepID=A0ABR8LRR2_9ALTE|nr:glycosyltransferase family 4 protein [Salinimonas profundi]MBD3586629.1 glycosyltransferase family 4 protein [Salinimonas profundi]